LELLPSKLKERTKNFYQLYKVLKNSSWIFRYWSKNKS